MSARHRLVLPPARSPFWTMLGAIVVLIACSASVATGLVPPYAAQEPPTTSQVRQWPKGGVEVGRDAYGAGAGALCGTDAQCRALDDAHPPVMSCWVEGWSQDPSTSETICGTTSLRPRDALDLGTEVAYPTGGTWVATATGMEPVEAGS